MLTEKLHDFMGSCSQIEDARVVIFGAPMDYTVSYRAGAREGPAGIRGVSYGLEEYSPICDKDLADYKYHDLGDIILAPGSVAKSLKAIAAVAREVLSSGKIPFMLGGEHLVTLPLVESAAALYPGLSVLHFDAHADMRDNYMEEKLSHATVMRRISEVVGPEKLYHMGIRSGTREEFRYLKESGRYFPGVTLGNMQEVAALLAGAPVYITIDIDVFDPGFAPGTGTPEPGGCVPREFFNAFLALKGLNVVGMDVVEVCPPCETAPITSMLAAKLVREMILLFGS